MSSSKVCWLGLLLWCGAARGVAQQLAPAITLIGESSNEEHIGAAYQDDFQDLIRLRFQPDTVTGRWQPLRLPTTHALWLQFDASQGQFVAYAQPGDTLYIQAHPGQAVYYTFRDGRNRPARQAELNFFNELHRKGLGIEVPDYVNLFVNARYPSQVERLCAKFDQRMRLLQRQRDSLHFSPAFFGYAAHQLRAQYLSALLQPYWARDKAYAQFPATYAQLLAAASVPQFLAADSLALTSPPHRAVAMSYVQYLSRDSVGTPAELAVRYRAARTALRGPTRDYVMFLLLKQNSAAYPTYREQFGRDCHTPAYPRYLDSLAARPSALPSHPELLNATLRRPDGTTLTWAQLLARNRGKVLYLDLWASWCGPCVGEMPASAKLQAELAGQPVQFVFLSIDTDAAKWQQGIAKHQLDRFGAQHYQLDQNSPLARFLNAPPIPRYVVVDKQGQVVTLDAARPSSPLLRADLARLLQ